MNQNMQSNSDVVRGFIDEVLNQGNIEASGKYFWDDMVEQVPLPGQGPGLEGLKNVLRGIKTAFPDIHWKIEEQIAEGDKVVTRFEWTGTHRGTFLGVPATRKISESMGRGY
jgi:predicted ester cyclase